MTGISEEMADVGMAMNRAEKTGRMKAKSKALDDTINPAVLTDYTSNKNEIEKELEKITVQNIVEEELAKLKSERERKKKQRGAKSATMSKKAKTKSRAAASKLKSRGKLRTKKKASARKSFSKQRKKASVGRAKAKSASFAKKSKIVRIMGQGQFTVDNKTLKRLNDIDNSIVELVSNERSDDFEFKKRLSELNDTVLKNGKPIDPREIIKSDIILPSADLSVDEAKRLFRGEGVIPEL